MDSVAKRLQQLLAAVGEPSRFQIVLELARRERHVSDLAKAIGLSQSCTTRHLQALERAGAVQTRRFGKRVVASLALQAIEVSRLLQWLRAGTELDAYAQPGRTGGTEARPELPQDAPPRQVRRSARTPGRATRVRTSRPPAPPTGSRAGPQRSTGAGREDRPHAGPGASDTPPVTDPDSPRSPRPPRPDLEDFLL
ncbi:MAG: ArsR/SmtB family transcription factor [Solirubrobacterales bacterium]